MEMAVVATGYYGMANFGDDLFRDAVREGASALWPQADLKFVAPDVDSPDWVKALYARHSRAGSMLRALTAARALSSGHIAYCGGSLFQDVRGVRTIHRLAATLNIGRFEALGVSVGPFASQQAEERVQNFMGRFERIVVRDVESHEWLANCGLRSSLGGDIAALSDKLNDYGSCEQRGGVAIAPCGTAGAFTDSYVQGVVHAVRVARQRGVSDVNVVALNSHPVNGDFAVCRALSEALERDGAKARIIDYSDVGISGVIEILSSSKLVIATRLHAGIVAYLTETPVVLVAYHRKSIDFAKDVGLSPASVVGTSSLLDEWEGAMESATAQPSMTAEVYRERAIDAYFK